MDKPVLNFEVYFSIGKSLILPVLLIGFPVGILFLFLLKKGYTKYEEKRFGTLVCGLFLSFSAAVVIVMTFYGRIPGDEYAFRFQLFGSYIESFRDNNIWLQLQIVMNILIFVPIGIFLPCCFRMFEKNKSILLSAMGVSCLIEIIQGVTKIGMFELDDILGNVMGAEIGYLIWWGMRRIGCKH